MSYRLTNEAADDLANLLEQGIEHFGVDAALAYYSKLFQMFDLIVSFPEIARERTELSPSVRVHPFGSHLIVYIIDSSSDVLIVRVRHAHEDWLKG
jgi:toxin ParE1/3/4